MEYYSKADLLRSMGKSCKDTRLVDRMIKRGEVEKVGGVYKVKPKEETMLVIEFLHTLCECKEEIEMVDKKLKEILNNKHI